MNQKWYVDLLYGNPDGYESWQGSAGGPPMIFYFEAFDEQWKGIDDGWGLWNIDRQARYALCGTPAGPACNDDLYEGAGYYVQSSFSTITFDSPDINYSFLDFGGTGGSAVVADPIGGANKVARVIRSDAAVEFAGTVVGTSGDTVGIIPFDADNTQMTVRVYSPAAGIPVRLKVEDSTVPCPAPPSGCPETEVVTTTANAWETLTFDFANPVAGSLNLDFNYDKLIIFFNFGKTGAEAGVQTFYFDDIEFIGGGGTGGGGGGGTIVFASGYKSDNRTVEDGEWGFYSGNFTNYTQTITGGGFVDARPAGVRRGFLCLPGRLDFGADDRRLHGHLHDGAGLHRRGTERRRDAQWPDEPEDRARHGRGVVPAGQQQGADRAHDRQPGVLQRRRRVLPDPGGEAGHADHGRPRSRIRLRSTR